MAESDSSVIHDHCSVCFKMNCMLKPDNITSCPPINCPAACGVRLHMCKLPEHKLVCQKERVSCINKECGCPIEIIREKMAKHLSVCPANVILCSSEWNRWPMYSQDRGWKAPLPIKNPHVKCGQLDVAFALRDQTVLIESFKTPIKTRRILRNPLTQQYPAVPIQSLSSMQESWTSDSSQLSDDDSGTPWDLNQSPPGLQRTIANRLSAYSSSSKKTENKSCGFDYVSGKQGLKRLAEIAKENEMKGKEFQKSERENQAVVNLNSNIVEIASDTKLSSNNMITDSMDGLHDDLNIYHEDKKLHEILGLDLTIHFISAYQAKPLKMFTFLCGREFRREEYAWHVKNFHSEIQCNLNNWFEQRCPLSYAGCTFSFQRFNPGNPNGAIVHSPLLQTVGFSANEEFRPETESNTVKQEAFQTEVDRQKLREATPEIHTSYKCDSAVHVIPRYRSVSREPSPLKHQFEFEDKFSHSLTDLPFEVLQNIVRHLDSFSIQLLSMTCKLLQSVCCSLLEEKGIVSLVWEKRSPETALRGPLWNVAYKVRLSHNLELSPNFEIVHPNLRIYLNLYLLNILENVLGLLLQIFLYLKAFESNTTSDWLNHMV